MPEITLTDATFNALLDQRKPALILFEHPDYNLRGDFVTAFKKAIEAHPELSFIRLNIAENPEIAARFEVGNKPVLVGWHLGEERFRRVRPWGSDVSWALENLNAAATATTSIDDDVPIALEEQINMTDVNLKPVNVTDENFQAEVIDYELPVLVDFWAEWCGPCRQVGPILDKLAAEFAGQIRIAKVDVDANPQLSQAFNIRSIPNLMMIKNQTIVFNQPGALPEGSLRELIQKLIELEVPQQSEDAQPE